MRDAEKVSFLTIVTSVVVALSDSASFSLIKRGEITRRRSAKIIKRRDVAEERLAIKLANIINIKKVIKSQQNAK